MFEMLVVSLDGSELSTRAVPIAGAIARAARAGVRVVGIPHNDGELAWMHEHVHDAARLLTAAQPPEVDVFVDGDPAGALLKLADDPRNMLCFASHDHAKPVAAVLHSVGSHLIQHATHPFLVVGKNADVETLANDVVVALDGVSDPDALLSTATSWARRLGSSLRIVTVYEPVPADIREPDHFTRTHGPGSDPGLYLEGIRSRLDSAGFAGDVEMAAIPDPVSVTTALAQHLEDRPALLLIVGRRVGAHIGPGVLRELLHTVTLPVLVATDQP